MSPDGICAGGFNQVRAVDEEGVAQFVEVRRVLGVWAVDRVAVAEIVEVLRVNGVGAVSRPSLS